MGKFSSATSVLRKFLVIGWALAVLWIYLGNLVNFHQNRIWGKQLIPVACSSTRSKEKDNASFVKNDGDFKYLVTGHQFDFTIPDLQILNIHFIEKNFSYFILSDAPALQWGISALFLRGPPAA